MKRIIPIILSLVLCISCLASPVAASSFEVPKTYFNVLDYATPNDFASTAVSLPDSQGTVSFDIPGEMFFSYVDILVSSTSDITSAVINNSDLNIIALSAGIFRLEGIIPYTSYSSFSLGLYCSSASVVTFIHFHAFNEELTPQSILGSADFFDSDGMIYSKQQSSPSTTFSYTFPNLTTDLDHFIVDLYSTQWASYDYLAFRFRTRLNVTSIVGMTSDGKIPLPVTTTVINDTSSDSDTWYYYCIIDVSSLDRTNYLTSYPVVQVNLNRYGEKSGAFNFYDCTGFVNVDYVDPELHFFRKFASNVEDWFTDLKSGIVNKLSDVQYQLKSSINNFRNEVFQSHLNITNFLSSLVTGVNHEDDANSFNESVSDQSQELEDMTNIMGSVEKPDINDIDLSTGTMVDSNSLVLATSGLSNILSNEIIVRVILMALTFGLVGFILYGKK